MFSKLLSSYSFEDFWHLEWIGITLLLVGLYLWLVGPFLRRFPNLSPITQGKKSLFLSGLLVNYIVLGSPLELLSSYLFSAHMLQMALYYLVMPPLLLAGVPPWLLRPVLRNKVIKSVFSFLTRPVISIFMFNMLVSFYHFPIFFDFFAVTPLYDSLIHTIMLFSAFFMWWNIVCPLPEWKQLSEVMKMAYIAMNVVLLYPACALIMFSNSILYSAYVGVPQLFDFLPALEDQRAGGVVMNITQELVLGIIIIPIIYRWVQKQKETDLLETAGPYQENGQ